MDEILNEEFISWNNPRKLRFYMSSRGLFYSIYIHLYSRFKNVGLIFFFLFRFRVLYRQTGSPGTVR